MEWIILEHRGLWKKLKKLPKPVQKKYDAWKNLVRFNGPKELRNFSGLHDEKLKGERLGQRSSRLTKSYRVIYEIERKIVTVKVIDVTKHKY